MRDTLAKWVGDADNLHHVYRFGVQQLPLELSYMRSRGRDYYLSLVGELFHRMREPYGDKVDWSRLGNALTLVGVGEFSGDLGVAPGILSSETALFAASAFYFGGYSASAYLTLKAANPDDLTESYLACYELLVRPATIRSEEVRTLVSAVRRGDLQSIRNHVIRATEEERQSLHLGPDEWVGSRLYRLMVEQFERTNIRAVLPNGEHVFWNPLVQSLLNRVPPVWDFFPSQIAALESGLLDHSASFSLQMPTGSGKTAICETLLFHHIKLNPDVVAILLVPFRSLAAELRGSLVKRLNWMGISARCAYGGTVPTGDEVRELDVTRVLVATPESLSGLLSANPDFFERVSLVVCDEGHLLDGGGRGVGLELLLSRLRARESGAPRFVFVSAIVPNIEEINAWLGGTDETVVRSDYRPALAEFSVLKSSGTGASANIVLQLHPQETEAVSFSVEGFLVREDFHHTNPITGRTITYNFNSVKTRAIAAARKTMSMGAVAVFAANKRGRQGAVGLAEELLAQLKCDLRLPEPIQYVRDIVRLEAVTEYFGMEYGPDWVGTQALAAGAVLHHGDIPQESREIVEELLRQENVRLVICTSTLAEGVNLPIRTMVLYSVRRQTAAGGGSRSTCSRHQKPGWPCGSRRFRDQGACCLR